MDFPYTKYGHSEGQKHCFLALFLEIEGPRHKAASKPCQNRTVGIPVLTPDVTKCTIWHPMTFPMKPGEHKSTAAVAVAAVLLHLPRWCTGRVVVMGYPGNGVWGSGRGNGVVDGYRGCIGPV